LVSARWEHFGNGITADLEAMKRAGIGGVPMETSQGTPPAGGFGGPLWRGCLSTSARRQSSASRST
jgi:hypothetical protein